MLFYAILYCIIFCYIVSDHYMHVFFRSLHIYMYLISIIYICIDTYVMWICIYIYMCVYIKYMNIENRHAVFDKGYVIQWKGWLQALRFPDRRAPFVRIASCIHDRRSSRQPQDQGRFQIPSELVPRGLKASADPSLARVLRFVRLFLLARLLRSLGFTDARLPRKVAMQMFVEISAALRTNLQH